MHLQFGVTRAVLRMMCVQLISGNVVPALLVTPAPVPAKAYSGALHHLVIA